MINPSHSSKIFLCRKAVDFRFGYDRLAGLCKSVAREDPYNGSVFLFFNRSYTRAKVIYFDGTGSVMILKSLEKGTFKAPKLSKSREFASIHSTGLLMLLEGLSTEKIKRQEAWKPCPSGLETDD